LRRGRGRDGDGDGGQGASTGTRSRRSHRACRCLSRTRGPILSPDGKRAALGAHAPGIVARDARSGRLLWRAAGGVFAAAAGRVYTQDATLDLATGEQVATHPPLYTGIRFAQDG
jgi:hypothetical protein